jgi:hypothetical protein
MDYIKGRGNWIVKNTIINRYNWSYK